MVAGWQVYSRLYHNSKLKKISDEKWPAERASLLARKAAGEKITNPLTEAAPLWFRNKIAMAEFKDETDEVKAEVEKHQQSMVTKDEVFDSGEGADPEETKRIAKATAMNE